MKRIKLFLVVLLSFLVLPFSVFAEDEVTTTAEESKEVKVYFFRGEGCPHCQEAEEWFDSIEEEYGSYFKIVDYEVWYNEENSKLMEKVAEARGETANGVPYIIVGNKSWNGYTEDYNEEIISQIKSEFEKDINDRYDIMQLVDTGTTANNAAKEEDTGSDVIALLLILVVVGGVCFGIYKARSSIK